jgi:hypothetical protein
MGNLGPWGNGDNRKQLSDSPNEVERRRLKPAPFFAYGNEQVQAFPSSRLSSPRRKEGFVDTNGFGREEAFPITYGVTLWARTTKRSSYSWVDWSKSPPQVISVSVGVGVAATIGAAAVP